MNTQEAYQAYLDTYPEGEHRAEALITMEHLDLGPGKAFRDCTACPPMMVLPAGEFWQGSSADDPLAASNERPRHVVRVGRPFAIGIEEITFAEWDACVADGGCRHQPGDNGWGRGAQPVIMVSWNDAQEYVGWLSEKTRQDYRLPSESEWEYAARAGEESPWQGGSAASLCRFGNIAGAETDFRWKLEDCSDPRALGTLPAGSLAPNPFGLHDMIGNVAEWTSDCLNLSYLDAPADGSAWGRGICSSHMTRGGSWVTGARESRLPARFNLDNGDRNDFTGFRVVRSVEE
jgi:formylglycine-generating enzyme required for sulfatase activity